MVNNRYPESITSEELEKCNLSWFKGEIVVIEDIDTFNRVLPRLQDSEILGFDTETKPTFKKGRKNKVSLIQLANDDIAFLIRINRIGIPPQLAEILGSPEIIKAGVAVHDDIRYLRRIDGFSPSGFVDLQKFVRDYGIGCSGLRKLTAIVLGFRISKRQQKSNWEADILTEAQKIYAATDAWVCHQIYSKLLQC